MLVSQNAGKQLMFKMSKTFTIIKPWNKIAVSMVSDLTLIDAWDNIFYHLGIECTHLSRLTLVSDRYPYYYHYYTPPILFSTRI